jgi:hypothetical protein
MPRILNLIFTPLICLVLLFPATTLTPANAETAPSTTETEQSKKSIVEWFEKYDEIRRSAEMSTGEKLKYGGALKKALKSGGALSDGTKKFVEKMRAKFEAAAAATKKLPEIPETKDLQEGYVQYFTEMERSFAECITIQEITPDSTKSKSETKAKLEKLSAKNKKLDGALREKYVIPKHKHS